MELPKSAEVMRRILGLTCEPIAVKFFENEVQFEGFERPSERRYCQILMEARKGKKLLLTADNISCPAAAWALGLKEPPPKLSSGEMPAAMGIFGSPTAAKHTLNTMPHLKMGKYKMVACCPMGEAPFVPDVIVVESSVEHLMWIALASVFDTGGRLSFDTAILQATCVDCTITPFLRQELNATLGCYGCREATDLSDSEAVLGFPYCQLDKITASLEKLNEKAIPRVRGKTVYKALMSRKNREDMYDMNNTVECG